MHGRYLLLIVDILGFEDVHFKFVLSLGVGVQIVMTYNRCYVLGGQFGFGTEIQAVRMLAYILLLFAPEPMQSHLNFINSINVAKMPPEWTTQKKIENEVKYCFSKN